MGFDIMELTKNQCIKYYHIKNIQQAKQETPKAQTYPDKPILRLKLLCILNRIINQSKPCRFSTTKVSPELENKDCIWVLDLIHSGKLLLQLSLHIKSTKDRFEAVSKPKKKGSTTSFTS